MKKPQFETTFNPAQTTLLSSIQRAKQRIFSKNKQQIHQKTISQNDQNNSIYGNLQKSKYEHKQSRIASNMNTSQNQTIYVDKRQRIFSGQRKQQKQIVANAIKVCIYHQTKYQVLQDKISILQQKNKKLTQIVQKKQKYRNSSPNKQIQSKKESQNNISKHIQNSTLRQIQHNTSKQTQHNTAVSKQSNDFWVLKQQCQSLKKVNTSLAQQLSKHKQHGKKLNFYHLQPQNIIDHSNIYESKQQIQLKCKQQIQLKCKKQIQLKYKHVESINKQLQRQITLLKNTVQNQKKKNFTILKLHQQQIIKNQQLTVQIKQQYQKIDDLNNKIKQRKSIVSKNRSSLSPQLSAVNINMIKKKNQQLINQNKRFIQQNQNIIKMNEMLQRQIKDIQRKYLQTKQAFIQLYRDLNKYHPQTITTNIKYLFQKIKKQNKSYQISDLLKSRSNHFIRFSHSKKSRISAFKSKSGKKGLKMQDLNSSNKSQRTHSKHSNRSNKSVYRSPYQQQYLKKGNRIKSMISPPRIQKSRQQKNKNNNNQKLSEIQKIIMQIKQVSKQIKNIKSEHRNLSVKMDNQRNSSNNIKIQQRINQLIQKYNDYNNKLQSLKQQKDKLAMETVPNLEI